jgi:hypothetical protein
MLGWERDREECKEEERELEGSVSWRDKRKTVNDGKKGEKRRNVRGGI